MSQLAGRVAIVTGGSGGIGRAICAALETAGARINAPSHSVLDVRDLKLCENHTADVKRVYGRLDFLITCHAATQGEGVEPVIGIDLIGTGNMASAYSRSMDTGGRIVLLSSIRSHWPRKLQIEYAAAKAGVEGLTRALAVQLGPRGILTNCIAPGAVLTSRTEENIDAGIVSESELISRTPTGRLTTPEEVADLAVYLCGPHHINGQVITIDGGWSVSG